MNRQDWNFLIGLLGVTGLILVVLVVTRDGAVITIEQTVAVLRTVVIMCLAWILLESVQ